MQLKLRKWVKNSAFYIILIFTLALMPMALYESAEFETRAIISTLAIDKSEEEYEVSGMVVIENTPNQLSSNTQVVSSKGRNFSEALYKLSMSLGKEIGLAHCDAIIISDSLKDEDITKVLDYCIRGNNLTKNSKLLTCKGNAKELLEVNSQRKDETGLSLAKLVTTGSDYLSIVDMDLENFYIRYYTESPVVWTTVLELQEKEQEQQSSGEGDSSGNSGSEGSKPQKEIKSEGNLAIYKEGKLVMMVEDDVANTLNIINPLTKRGYILLEDVQDGDKEYKQVSINVLEKKTRVKYRFDGDTPICDIKLKIYVNLEEVWALDKDVYDIDATVTHISDELKNEIKDYLTNNFNQFKGMCTDKKVDYFGVNTGLYRYAHKKWKTLVSEEEKQAYFVDDVQVNFDIKIETKI